MMVSAHRGNANGMPCNITVPFIFKKLREVLYLFIPELSVCKTVNGEEHAEVQKKDLLIPPQALSRHMSRRDVSPHH